MFCVRLFFFSQTSQDHQYHNQRGLNSNPTEKQNWSFVSFLAFKDKILDQRIAKSKWLSYRLAFTVLENTARSIQQNSVQS